MRGEGGGRVARRAAAAAACRCSGWISGGAPHADGAASDELGGQSASISRGGGAAGMAIGSGLKGNMAGGGAARLLPFWRRRNSYCRHGAVEIARGDTDEVIGRLAVAPPGRGRFFLPVTTV